MNLQLNTRKLFAEKRHAAIRDKAKHLGYAWIGLWMLTALPFIMYLKPYIGPLMVCGTFAFLSIILVCITFALTVTFCEEYVMDYPALFSLNSRKDFTVSSYADYTFEYEKNACATQILADGGSRVENFSESSIARYETPHRSYEFKNPFQQTISKTYLCKDDPFRYVWDTHAEKLLRVTITWRGEIFYR